MRICIIGHYGRSGHRGVSATTLAIKEYFFGLTWTMKYLLFVNLDFIASLQLVETACHAPYQCHSFRLSE